MKYRVKLSPYEVFNLIVLSIISVIMLLSTFWIYSHIYLNNGNAQKTYFNNRKPSVVISESMEPTIMTNAVIVVERTPFDDIEVGDIILAETQEHGMVVHRVIEDNYGEVFKENPTTGETTLEEVRYYVTKGDNNEERDKWVVAKENYQGKVVEIHNDVADMITFYFGDIGKATPFYILWGLFLTAITLSCFIVVVIWLYDFILIPYFLRREMKKKKDAVIVKQNYYSWLKDRVIEKDAIETIEQLNIKRNIIERFIFNFRLMMWHNAMKAEAQKAMKSRRRYEKLKGVFKVERFSESDRNNNTKS